MHYLYRHIRLDKNEPFYIGIGTYPKSSHSKYNRAVAKSNRSIFWKNIVAKTDYVIEIIIESEDYEFIKKKEVEFILLYGRKDLGKGSLVNMTDGGEGVVGVSISEYTRKKMSDAQKNKLVPKEVGEKISKAKKGKAPANYTNSFSKRVKHIESGAVYKSITSAAKTYNIRRCTLSKILENDISDEFIIIDNEEYFKLSGIKDWTSKKCHKELNDRREKN